MSFASDLRDGIQLADDLFRDGGLEARVTYHAWLDDDERGAPQYEVPKEMPAVVDQRVMLRRSAQTGEMIMTSASILLLKQLEPNGAPKRQSEPIDTRDVFMLPDGRTGPIVSIGAPVDGETQRPFYSEVLLGV